MVLIFLPLIPWIIGGIVVIAGLTVAVAPKKTVGKTLGVLGMKGSGKTRFLSNLGLVEFSEGTSVDEYCEHTLRIGDRTIKIKRGEDIGGDRDIRGYYTEWVNNKDITIFIFDGACYLKDPEYRSQTRARLHYIHNIAKKKFGEDSDFKNIVLIASHSDQFNGKKEEMCEKICNDVKDRKYVALMKSNLFAANLVDKKEVMEIAKCIF